MLALVAVIATSGRGGKNRDLKAGGRLGAREGSESLVESEGKRRQGPLTFVSWSVQL